MMGMLMIVVEYKNYYPEKKIISFGLTLKD